MVSSISEADILIAAAGAPGLVKSSWLKEGVVAIDVGTTFIPMTNDQGEEKLVITGDIQFNEETLLKCKQITPVPGGVGPMTVAMLMHNVVKSWEKMTLE